MNNNCINFRDVGEFVNLLAGKKLLKEKALYRGGKISEIANLSQIESPKKIINLRRGKDPLFADIEKHQIATENHIIQPIIRRSDGSMI